MESVEFLLPGGGSEAAVRARTRIGRIKFRECEVLLCGVFIKYERKNLSELFKIGDTEQERDMVSEGE